MFPSSSMSRFSFASCFQLPACRNPPLRHASHFQHAAILLCVMFPLSACRNSFLRHGPSFLHGAILFCVVVPFSSMSQFLLASCFADLADIFISGINSRRMPIAKRVIRILVGWGKKPVNDFYIFAKNICDRISEKPVLFPKPPVDLAALKAELERFISVIAQATYGDSTVIVKRDSIRSEIHVMLRQLAHYVEYLCNIETDRTTQMQIVAASGFEAMSSTTAAEELLSTRIKQIDNPRTGVLRVRYKTAGRKARRYDVRMAVKGASDPESWPIRQFANAKDGGMYEGLTPGVVYTFQVRVMSKLGHGEWSPAVNKMCT
jgi:hypothetical protein